MDADAAGGQLTMRPVEFSEGSWLFVNCDTTSGELLAEVLDKDSQPINGLTLADCLPVSEDSTIREIGWQGGVNLEALCDQPVGSAFI